VFGADLLQTVHKMSTASLRADSDLRTSLTSTAWEDIVGGLFKSELWGRMAWLDVKRRYQRTTLGPFWNPATLHFTPSRLALSAPDCSTRTFVRFEYSILAYALVWRNFIFFLHNFIVYVVIAFLLQPHLIDFTALLAVLASSSSSPRRPMRRWRGCGNGSTDERHAIGISTSERTRGAARGISSRRPEAPARWLRQLRPVPGPACQSRGRGRHEPSGRSGNSRPA
jgi:hypothetical protein